MIRLVNEILSKQDKLLHFFASGWIFLMLINFTNCIFFSFLTTLLIGGIKEIYDWKYRNGADFYDIVANILGIFASMIIFINF
jgi:hypothetical protein